MDSITVFFKQITLPQLLEPQQIEYLDKSRFYFHLNLPFYMLVYL